MFTVYSLPRMKSQTRTSPFLQNTRKSWNRMAATEQVLSTSILGWVLHPGFCTGFSTMPHATVPLPIHMHNHILSHSWPRSSWSGHAQPPKVEYTTTVLHLPPRMQECSAVGRATLVLKHTFALCVCANI